MGAKGRLLLMVLTFASAVGFDSALAQSWVMTSAPITNWVSVAMSADGGKVVAAARVISSASDENSGPIYLSEDSGTNWTQTPAPITNWTSVAISADGSKLVACAGNGGSALLVSTNSGNAWLDRTPNSTWSGVNLLGVACSADAATLVTVSGMRAGPFAGSQVFVSTNMGETWTETELPSLVVSTAACSADGRKIIVGGIGNFYGSVFVSTNAGIDWIKRDFYGFWVSSASTATGNSLIFTTGYNSPNGPVFVSTDGGEHAMQVTDSDELGRSGDIAVSADGSRAVLAIDAYLGGPILISNDACTNWIVTDAAMTNWISAASSADGCRLSAAVGQASPELGGIYTWQTTPTPRLNIGTSGGGLLVSWVVPSKPFVLQENADLKTANWIDVPTQPTLNLSNLHQEMSVPLSNTNRFYRLKSL